MTPPPPPPNIIGPKCIKAEGKVHCCKKGSFCIFSNSWWDTTGSTEDDKKENANSVERYTFELDKKHFKIWLRKYTIKILLEAHALIEAHPSVWTQKMPIFRPNFPKNQACNKGTPLNIENICPTYAEKSRICYWQRISSPSPAMKIPLMYIVFYPTFIFVEKYWPSLASCEAHTLLWPGMCIFKILSICLQCQ